MKNRNVLASAIPVLAFAAVLPAQRPHMGNARPTTIAPVIGSTRTTTYFAASDGFRGVELYKTDGTDKGTTRVADIEAGARGSYPTQITWASGTGAFFTARTKNTGRELFYTDGTTTRLIQDVEPGKRGSDPRELTVIGSRVFFTARTSTHGRELWVATSALKSARPVTDLNPGPKSSSPYDLTVLAGVLYFAATDGAIGTELFRRKPGGTLDKVDIHGLGKSSTPSELTALGRYVYFAATSKNHGREVWRADATSVKRVTDIQGGGKHSNPTQLTAGSASLAFTALHPTRGRELFTLSPAGLRVASNFAHGHTIRNLTAGSLASGPVFWFSVRDPNYGVELFRTNRGASSTTVQLVHDVFTGSTGSSPSNLTSAGNKLLFRATTKAQGCELRITDGTNLTLLTDIKTGSGARGNAKSSYPGPLSRFGSKFLFSAEQNAAGIELWSTDGTPTGTKQVVAGLGLDKSPVVPSQTVRLPLVSRSLSAVEFDIEDAPKNQPGWMIFSALIPKNPIVIRGFMRGALMVDPSSPAAFFFPLVTDANGTYHKRIPFPPQLMSAPVPLGWQSVIKTGGFAEAVVAAQNDACTAGRGTTQGGKSATASGCADDDTGEADITVTAGSWSGDEAWLAVAMLTPYGERVPIDGEESEVGSNLWPIAPGETIQIHGTFDLFTPTEVEDPTEGTNRLLLLLFDEPPSADELDKGVEVWRSYC